jgi:putative heme iron utilization protein
VPNDPDLIHALPPQPPQMAARDLLRAARVATLATSDGMQPYAALVTPACMPDLSVGLLLSELALHTAHLRANPQCALFCMADPAPGPALANPQTRARLSLTCRAGPDPDPALRDRYLRLHPYAALYADFADFYFWRLQISRAQLVQGFAQAHAVSAADLVPTPDATAVLQAAEPGVLQHCNSVHPDSMRLLGFVFGGVEDAWKLVAVDQDGADLMAPSARVRLTWSRPVASADDLHQALVTLVDQARGISEIRQSGAGASSVGLLS